MVNYRSLGGEPVSTEDFVAIQRLVHRYSEAVVLRDGEQWGSCCAEDASWDLGRGRLVSGRPAIVELWTSAMAGMAAVVQMTHNGDVMADPSGANRALGRWFIDERYRRTTGDVGMLLAHYDDAYVRGEDDQWRFSSRFLQVHYHGRPDLSDEFQNTAAALAAAAGAADTPHA
jgi:hypothetical protein